ncbi:MAG: M48 family metallopeptidase [Clostridia bacterium]|nr:M48 family metallopeptidase [Clostridia bacterium]
MVFGKTEAPLTVIRSSRRSIGVEVKNGAVTVRAPFLALPREIDRILESHSEWIEKKLKLCETRFREAEEAGPLTREEILKLADRAARVIPPKVEHYAKLMNIEYGRITIRAQKTRWGSCSSKGNLNFNVLLMLAPDEVLDGVIVHELSHRKHMNHSKDFYDEILKVYPEYHKHDKWLKTHGHALMLRLAGMQ